MITFYSDRLKRVGRSRTAWLHCLALRLTLVVVFSMLWATGLCWAASAEIPSEIALVVDMASGGKLTQATDYAGYGALQMFTQLGVAYNVESVSALNNPVRLGKYRTVVYPGDHLTESSQEAVSSFVAQGGVFISGGLDKASADAGVKVLGSSTIHVPQVAGRFVHQAEHPILKDIKGTGLPVLLPVGSASYPVIAATNGAQGLGTAELGGLKGNALVIKQHGKGYYITFGVNPFATVGYGMGMVTEPEEEHYAFPTALAEFNKAFNWKTALAIKQTFVNDKSTNLIWGDEYGNLMLQTLLWAAKQRTVPVVWQWYWPNLHEFAASIQHDWDGGKGPDAAEFRQWEADHGVRSALYVLVPDKFPPSEAALWYKGGWEIALHADKNPPMADFGAKIAQDLETLLMSVGIAKDGVKGIAHHYLRYYKDAPLWWQRSGFEYDSSFYDMDWKQVFFTGSSKPFYLKYGAQILPVMELPSRNEDGVLMANNNAYYLGTTDFNLAKQRQIAYLNAVAAVNGHASWNGHPSHRHDAMHGIEMEDQYVAYLTGTQGFTAKNVWFARPIDISRWFRARSLVQTTQSWDGKVLTAKVTPAPGTEAALVGYSLLFNETVGDQHVQQITLNGQPLKTQVVEQAGSRFVAAVFDVKQECTVQVVYSR